jgi:hypothetical protein
MDPIYIIIPSHRGRESRLISLRRMGIKARYRGLNLGAERPILIF